MTDRTIRRVAIAAMLFVTACATLCSSGCVAPEAIEQLQRAAAANEGDMRDPVISDDGQRIARENAYVDHQAIYLLDSDYDRPEWVLELEAELKAGAE